MSNEEDIGTLIVVVLKARNLNDKHFYKQDVYATVNLNGIKKRTKVDVKGGQHPEWDEEIRFPIMKNQSTKYRKLETQCWSKEHRDDDLLGEGSVDISDTLKTGEFDEWVPLTVDGVVRGDIYLEMTFYSKTPAPVASQTMAPKHNLSVPVNSSLLQRRPSKLSPSERLSRPPQNSYSANANYNKKTPPRTPPKDNYSALPPVSNSQASVPSTLKPGLASPARPQQSSSYQPPPASHLQPAATSVAHQRIPSILRPANPKAAPEPVSTHSVFPSASTSGYSQQTNAPTPQEFPSHSHYNSSTSYLPSATNRVSSPSTPNEPWGSSQYPPSNYQPEAPISFSFPVPAVVTSSISPPPQSTTPFDHYHYHRQRTSSYVEPGNFNSPSPAPSKSAPQPTPAPDLPDPYLIARYQTPLPLPPGTDPRSSSPSHQQPIHNRTHNLPTPPSPSSPSLPVPAITPPARQPTPVDEERLRVLRQAELEVARRKEQEERDAELARQLDRDLAVEQERPPPPFPRKTPSPVREDPAAIARRIKAEDETRRREQEERDLELARQLDRELNLAESGSPRMPGGM
ncbi:hypothetical protein E1B28_011538 [Marasmius oreades]|uniref:C2 domain-containing protein n=1 Tax=Marasmius oreades TaxID=181124 RepID=A0A9P7RV25_9AGAR|nr:uncharacterized protein E1B28_011538 [Marasmius oreades]KAG7089905.1 hypothetical protein E1B28_011538 [Marasmius oreades]